MAIRASKPPLVLIAGPTASGKSALALALAEQIEGVIVNADATQIYRDLPILSAAPTAAELKRAEHRLFGIQDGADPCSAARWAAMARHEIGQAHARGAVPILVGGTGLYLRTLLDGIAPVPEIDAEVRRRVREASVEDNRAQLEQLDPEAAARLKPADTARIARALEVVLSTGRTLAQWQTHKSGRDRRSRRCEAAHPAAAARLALPALRRAFREDGRARRGGGGEALLERKLNPSLPVMRAIGVAEISAHLAGQTSLGEAITPASRPRDAMPSANIPGSRISRLAIGRGSALCPIPFGLSLSKAC